MQADVITEQSITNDTLFRARLDFAERCFANAQELSRFMDQKASYLLSAVALLTAALSIIAARGLDVEPASGLQAVLKGLSLIAVLAYLSVAFAVIYNATLVFRALSNVATGRTTAPGLIFPLILLDRFSLNEGAGEEAYYNALSRLGPGDILRDYANQIMAVSDIYRQKQRRINLSLDQFRWLTVTWIVTILLLLAAAVLR